VKQQLERNLEEIRLKLSRAEQALQASQVAENELRRSSEVCEQEGQGRDPTQDKKTMSFLGKQCVLCVCVCVCTCVCAPVCVRPCM
jgi:hypothetical protein